MSWVAVGRRLDVNRTGVPSSAHADGAVIQQSMERALLHRGQPVPRFWKNGSAVRESNQDQPVC